MEFDIYEWYRIDTGEIFYVGKGKGTRYTQKKNRSKMFRDYINKYNCYRRIVKYFNTEEDAYKAEYERIKYLQSIGQCVCNQNQGGYGGVSTVWTQEMRENCSINNPMKDEKQRQRMREHNPMQNKEVSARVASKTKRPIWIGEKRFDGLSDAARYYNTSSATILYWLKRGCTSDSIICYYDGEKPNYNAKVKGSYCKKSVFIDGILYPTIESAAKAIGGSPENLGKALKEHRNFKGHICTYGNQQPSCEAS